MSEYVLLAEEDHVVLEIAADLEGAGQQVVIIYYDRQVPGSLGQVINYFLVGLQARNPGKPLSDLLLRFKRDEAWRLHIQAQDNEKDPWRKQAEFVRRLLAAKGIVVVDGKRELLVTRTWYQGRDCILERIKVEWPARYRDGSPAVYYHDLNGGRFSHKPCSADSVEDWLSPDVVYGIIVCHWGTGRPISSDQLEYLVSLYGPTLPGTVMTTTLYDKAKVLASVKQVGPFGKCYWESSEALVDRRHVVEDFPAGKPDKRGLWQMPYSTIYCNVVRSDRARTLDYTKCQAMYKMPFATDHGLWRGDPRNGSHFTQMQTSTVISIRVNVLEGTDVEEGIGVEVSAATVLAPLKTLRFSGALPLPGETHGWYYVTKMYANKGRAAIRFLAKVHIPGMHDIILLGSEHTLAAQAAWEADLLRVRMYSPYFPLSAIPFLNFRDRLLSMSAEALWEELSKREPRLKQNDAFIAHMEACGWGDMHGAGSWYQQQVDGEELLAYLTPPDVVLRASEAYRPPRAWSHEEVLLLEQQLQEEASGDAAVA